MWRSGAVPVVLDQVTSQLADKIRKVKGVADLELGQTGVPAFAVRIRPDALKEFGPEHADVAASLRRLCVNGAIATFWRASDGQQLDGEVHYRPRASARTSTSSSCCRWLPRTARRCRWTAWQTWWPSRTPRSSAGKTASCTPGHHASVHGPSVGGSMTTSGDHEGHRAAQRLQL